MGCLREHETENRWEELCGAWHEQGMGEREEKCNSLDWHEFSTGLTPFPLPPLLKPRSIYYSSSFFFFLFLSVSFAFSFFLLISSASSPPSNPPPRPPQTNYQIFFQIANASFHLCGGGWHISPIGRRIEGAKGGRTERTDTQQTHKSR